MKTLIVEDDKIIQELLRIILKEYGECVTAETEEAAMDLFVQAHEQNAPFDLVTLDIMLSGGNGRNILKRIREFEKQKIILGFDGVRIIMISALGDKKTILGSFADQCEGYIVKPVTRGAVIKQLVELGFVES